MAESSSCERKDVQTLTLRVANKQGVPENLCQSSRYRSSPPPFVLKDGEFRLNACLLTVVDWLVTSLSCFGPKNVSDVTDSTLSQPTPSSKVPLRCHCHSARNLYKYECEPLTTCEFHPIVYCANRKVAFALRRRRPPPRRRLAAADVSVTTPHPHRFLGH